MAFIYLVWAKGTCLYKIGMTNLSHPRDRVSSLQTSSPHKLCLVGFFETEFPAEDELIQHSKWRDRKENGEWFSFSPWDLAVLSKDFNFSSTASLLDKAIAANMAQFSSAMNRELNSVLNEFGDILSNAIVSMSDRMMQTISCGLSEILEDGPTGEGNSISTHLDSQDKQNH